MNSLRTVRVPKKLRVARPVVVLCPEYIVRCVSTELSLLMLVSFVSGFSKHFQVLRIVLPLVS